MSRETINILPGWFKISGLGISSRSISSMKNMKTIKYSILYYAAGLGMQLQYNLKRYLAMLKRNWLHLSTYIQIVMAVTLALSSQACNYIPNLSKVKCKFVTTSYLHHSSRKTQWLVKHEITGSIYNYSNYPHA